MQELEQLPSPRGGTDVDEYADVDALQDTMTQVVGLVAGIVLDVGTPHGRDDEIISVVRHSTQPFSPEEAGDLPRSRHLVRSIEGRERRYNS